MNKNKVENTGVITKILLLLYLVVGLSPKVVEIEYEGFQWFYISTLNVVSLIYIYTKKEFFKPFFIGKKERQYFLIFLLFLIVSVISMTQSIFIDESIVHFIRILNVFAGIYIVYVMTRNNPKDFFEFICKVCTVLLIFHSIVTLSHFLGNYTKPRIMALYKSFLHYYGNINFFTASLIIKLPFVIYLFLTSKNIWKYISSIVVFTTILSLLYSGSRTALLSLGIILVLIIGYLLSTYFKEKKNTKIIQATYFSIIPIVAVFLFLNTNRLHRGKANSIKTSINFSNDSYKTTDRFIKQHPEILKNDVEIEDNDDTFTKLLKKSGRYAIWKSAYTLFKENILLGVGYGNYKAVPKPAYFKEKVRRKGNYSISVRVHNDFLEKYVETGIIGGTLHLLLFIFIFILIIKLLRNSKYKIIIFCLLLSGIAFFMDAFFNFPSERAPIQLFLVLISGLILAFYRFEKRETIEEIKRTDLKNTLYLVLTTLILFSTILNYMIYKVYKENTIFKNQKIFKKRGYNLTYEGFKDRVYSFPSLDQDGIKTKYYLASYAALEKKYDKTMEILNEELQDKPSAQDFLIKKLKAEIFLKGSKNIDSAEYYYRDVYEKYPAYKYNFTMLSNIYKGKKDNESLERLMNSYTKQNYVDEKEWINKVNYYNLKNRKIAEGIKMLDTALAYNKNNLDLLKAKLKLKEHGNTNSYYKTKNVKELYNEVVTLYNKREYAEARDLLYKILKENPKDYFAVQYIGIVEMNLKNYKTAIKYLTESINMKVFKDGKAEFCRAVCYEKLGEKEKSKKDYRASRKKKFPRALKLPKTKYE